MCRAHTPIQFGILRTRNGISGGKALGLTLLGKQGFSGMEATSEELLYKGDAPKVTVTLLNPFRACRTIKPILITETLHVPKAASAAENG